MAMEFAGQKLVAIGGSSGMGRATAADVVRGGGSVVVVGRSSERVEDTVTELSSDGKVFGITADLSDRAAVERVQQQLAAEHGDATLLVNSAGFFSPKPFLEHGGEDYDSYLELNRATFFLTQTVARGMIAKGEGGAIVNVGSMWAHQALAAYPGDCLLHGQGMSARVDPQPRHGAGRTPNSG